MDRLDNGHGKILELVSFEAVGQQCQTTRQQLFPLRTSISLFHSLFLQSTPLPIYKMTDWTSDANEALTLSLGMHLRHKCQNTLLTCGPNFSSIVRSQEDKETLAEDESYDEFHPNFTYPVRWARLSYAQFSI